jgi:hypothetical protein
MAHRIVCVGRTVDGPSFEICWKPDLLRSKGISFGVVIEKYDKG